MTTAELIQLEQNASPATARLIAAERAKLAAVREAERDDELKRRGPNSLERAYGAHLEAERLAGRIVWYGYEKLRLRLAEGAWYKPDYIVILTSGRVRMVECKGFWREASRVRVKVAAELHPWAEFVAVTRAADGGWDEEWFGGWELR